MLASSLQWVGFWPVACVTGKVVMVAMTAEGGWTCHSESHTCIRKHIQKHKLKLNRKAALDHQSSTTMFDCWYEDVFLKCCISFTLDVIGFKPFKNVNVYFVVHQWFLPWNFPMDAIFVCLLCWLMSTKLNWNTWGLHFFRYCGIFVISRMTCQCSWRTFSRLATGKIHHCSKFYPFVENGSLDGLL